MERLTESEKIRILAARKNISLSELARRFGVSQSGFMNRLKANNWRVSELQKIGEILGFEFITDFVEK